jgi:hypothetical protein
MIVKSKKFSYLRDYNNVHICYVNVSSTTRQNSELISPAQEGAGTVWDSVWLG